MHGNQIGELIFWADHVLIQITGYYSCLILCPFFKKQDQNCSHFTHQFVENIVTCTSYHF